MRMSIFKSRLAATAGVVVLCVSTLCAQTVSKHVIERGETLESIAARYGVTTEEIIKLNPDAAQFVYVGMELNLPEKPAQAAVNDSVAQARPATPQTPATEYVDENGNKRYVATAAEASTLGNASGGNAQTEATSGDLGENVFSSIGISYFASFDAADMGYYMFGFTTLAPSGWGADFHIGFNYGLVDKDYAGCAFLVGPAYGYAFDRVMLAASLDFLGTYLGQGKGEDLKFNWGFALMPKAIFRLGKVRPWVGVNAMWAKGADKLSVGFEVGIGIGV